MTYCDPSVLSVYCGRADCEKCVEKAIEENEFDGRHNYEEIQVRNKQESLLIHIVDGYVIAVFHNGSSIPIIK